MEEWHYGDLDAGFAGAAVVLLEKAAHQRALAPDGARADRAATAAGSTRGHDGAGEGRDGSPGPAEHHAFPGVGGGLGDEPLGIADAFRRNQDALGIHAGQDVAKALAFVADQILGGHLHVIEIVSLSDFGHGPRGLARCEHNQPAWRGWRC